MTVQTRPVTQHTEKKLEPAHVVRIRAAQPGVSNARFASTGTAQRNGGAQWRDGAVRIPASSTCSWPSTGSGMAGGAAVLLDNRRRRCRRTAACDTAGDRRSRDGDGDGRGQRSKAARVHDELELEPQPHMVTPDARYPHSPDAHNAPVGEATPCDIAQGLHKEPGGKFALISGVGQCAEIALVVEVSGEERQKRLWESAWSTTGSRAVSGLFALAARRHLQPVGPTLLAEISPAAFALAAAPDLALRSARSWTHAWGAALSWCPRQAISGSATRGSFLALAPRLAALRPTRAASIKPMIGIAWC